ncbi:MAG: DNA glycosylase [Opitutaceae bacterium]
MAATSPSASTAPRWSVWTPLALRHAFTADSLRESLDGGQAFRWRWRAEDNAWQGIFATHAVQLRLGHACALEFRAATDSAAACAALLDYLGMAGELDSALARLPLSSDAVLAGAVAACPGLILLRQQFADTLLAFILSSTKQIPQIRQLCDTLAQRFGEELAPGLHALPTWARLAQLREEELRACSLGFRARYVTETARFLRERPGWLARVERAPYPEAKAALCELPGVGDKVADCVLLFGARRLGAFPVDVWILRTLVERYDLRGWRLPQLAQFGRVHFGPHAGFAQQYLFAAARRSR